MRPQTDTRQPDADLFSALRARLAAGDAGAVQELLEHAQPADVAAALEDMPEERQAQLFRLLDTETAAEVLGELSKREVQFLAEATPRRLEAAVGALEPDEVADVLDVLPEQQAEALLEGFAPEQATTAEQLLAYPPDTAGGLMTTQFVSLPADATAREAVEITQRSSDAETVGHLFVADAEGRLDGYLPLQHLVFAPPESRVRDLMEDYPHAVTPETDQEELVRAATRYDLDAVPVVDAGGRLIGVVTVDDILEAAEQEADEDIYHLAGTGERDPVHASVARSTRMRLPWMMISVLDGLFMAAIVGRFEATVRGEIALMYYIPLIPLMGGQMAIQTSAIMVRGLALGSFRHSMIARFLTKQVCISALLACCCGLLTGLLSYLVVGAAPQLALAVGLAVVAAMFVSGLLGVAFPLLFNRIGIDPAISSGPFITMLNDLICILIYLLLGMLLTGPGS